MVSTGIGETVTDSVDGATLIHPTLLHRALPQPTPDKLFHAYLNPIQLA